MQYSNTDLVILSDVHLCHIDWYGMTSPKRMQKMIDDVNAFRKEYAYDTLLFLGDLSLDFWETGIFGSWRHMELSNTQRFLQKYASQLKCTDRYILPGNHEQYGCALWKELTGYERQYYIEKGGYLLFMLDTFAGDLDPSTDNHGVYSFVDVPFVRRVMDEHPGMPVLLFSHFFDLGRESEAFRELVCDERVIALFCGHDHVTKIEDMGETYANKTLFHCGEFSYTTQDTYENAWGWRTLSLRKEGIRVTYYTPESQMADKHIEAGTKQDVFVANPLADR